MCIVVMTLITLPGSTIDGSNNNNGKLHKTTKLPSIAISQ